MNTTAISQDFAGRAAAVTGSSRGIGRAIAEELASRGCAIAISDLPERSAYSRATATELRERYGVATIAVDCDVTVFEDNRRLARCCREELGGLHVWINNAGIRDDDLLIRMKAEAWERVVDVNLKGAFYGVQAAAKFMMKARRGKILNIGSVSGFYGNAGQINYSSAKAGLNALTKSAARELAPRNINVNHIAAGFVRNDFADGLPEDVIRELEGRIPLKAGDPEREIARAARFLVSDEANFITGATLRVDGGMAIGF